MKNKVIPHVDNYSTMSDIKGITFRDLKDKNIYDISNVEEFNKLLVPPHSLEGCCEALKLGISILDYLKIKDKS